MGFRNLGAELLTYIKRKEYDKIPREYMDPNYVDNNSIKECL